jgi:hypothetical protein
MKTVFINTVDRGDTTEAYYIGDAANCPPVPAVGNLIEGKFGKGEVSKVEHIVKDSEYTINLHFSNTEAYYEPNGF